MISLTPDVFYIVYPPWAKFSWQWDNLRMIFSDPISAGILPDDGRLEQLGYEPGSDKYELINGPVGNGIIKGIGNTMTAKYLWMAVLIRDAMLVRFPGFPVSVLEYNVCWLEQKETAEHKMGLSKRFQTFLPTISLDYDDLPDSSVYASLAFRKGRIDEEVSLRFQMRCRTYGWKCEPVQSGLINGTGAKLASPLISHHWFIVAKGNDDLGILASKMFYLGCAAKQEANRDFQSIHLVGSFDRKPSMAQAWMGRDGQLKYGH